MTYLRGGVWRHFTLVLIALSLLITFTGFHAQDDITRGVYASMAGRTALYLVAAFGIPMLMRPTVLRMHRLTPWVTGAVTVAVLGLLFALWWTGREGLGYQWTQALHLVASPGTFGDLHTPLNWFECVSQGTDPYAGPAGGCQESAMSYGPGMLWWSSFAFLEGHFRVLGLIAVALSVLSLVWLSKRSQGRGQLALLFIAIAPAWTMLLNHGNLDQLIIWTAILIVVLTTRMNPDRLLPWVLAAIPIWIIGTWKYYPFAMIIAFIPALRIKRGWMLIVGFITAALAFFGLYWSQVKLSLGAHVDMSGGVGRSTWAAFIGGQAKADRALGWPDLLIAAVLITAAIWGWTSTRPLPTAQLLVSRPTAILAAAGAATAIGSVTLPGVGFPYKAALLVLAVPLLSRLGGDKRPELWRSTTAFLVLVVLGTLAEWNPLLTSLAVNVSAAYILGLSLRPLLANWRARAEVAA